MTVLPADQPPSEPPVVQRADRLAHALEIIDTIAATDLAYCSVLHDPDQFTLPDLEDEFRLYGERVVDMIAALFTIYTGDDCAVCIKILNLTEDVPNTADLAAKRRKGELPFVYTFWRDAGSRHRRDRTDVRPELAVYRHDRNTGLKRARQTGYWHCNDLSALGIEYSNVNDGWPEDYNATAILCIAPPCEGKPANPFGFLCIDNMRGGFDDGSCRHVLSIVANLLYYSIWLTTAISEKRGESR